MIPQIFYHPQKYDTISVEKIMIFLKKIMTMLASNFYVYLK